MRLSLGSWAFSFGPYADHPVPFDQVARRLSETGFDGIEVGGFPPHVTLETYPTTQSRRELGRFLGELKLGVSGYAADFTSVNPIVPGNRQRYLDLFQRNVELAAEIGSPNVRVDTGAAPGSIEPDDYDAARKRLAELWHLAAEMAEASGVRVVWEFEPGFVFNKPSEIVRLHDEVASDNFKILFDTCHAYMCSVAGSRQRAPQEKLAGGVAELLGLLRRRIGHIHLIDSDGTLYGDETSTHRPFGEGLIDFGALTPKIANLAGIEWWCVDLGFWPGAWECVDRAQRFVRELAAVTQPG